MSDLSATQLQSLANGIATAMTNLQTRIEDRILAETLPIAGDRLAAAARGGEDALTATEDLGAALSARLNDLAAQAAGGDLTAAAVIAALEAALATAGYAGVVVGITTGPAGVNVTLAATHTQAYTQGLSGDLGFGGLNLEAEGSATVEAEFEYDLEFGVAPGPGGGGFYFDAGGAEEVTLSLRVDELTLGGTVSIDGESFAAADAGSVFAADIAINVAGLGQISAADLATATLTGTMAGGADLAIEVALAEGVELLPPMSAIFDVDWDFTSANINPDNTNANFGTEPVVMFRDVTMDLGGFMEQFIAPLINRLQDLLEPLEPIIDVLTTNIRLLSDFPVIGNQLDVDGLPGVTLLDLIERATGADTSSVAAIDALIDDVSGWVDLLDGLGFGEGNLNLGDFTIDGDIRANGFDLLQAATDFVEGTEANLANIIAGLSGNGWNSGGRGVLQDLTQEGGMFHLPVLSDPSTWIDLLLGRPVDLLEVDLPELSFDTGNVTLFGPVPLFFGIFLDIDGGVAVTVDLDFGFNTRGLLDPELSALDGLYIIDGPGAEITIDSFIGVNVALEGGLVGLEGSGNIRGLIEMDLIGGIDPTRIYFDEFGAALADNPFSIFNGRGEITLGFSAVLDTIFGELWRWESPRITLGNFSFGGSTTGFDPVLGAKTGGTLNLNIGDRAGNRANPTQQLDVSERMELSLAPDGETLRVNFFPNVQGGGYETDTFRNITHVTGDGGNLADEIILAEGLLVTTSLHGGTGNDVLSGGDLRDTLYGERDNDVLFGYLGNDQLFGGLGDDFMNGGAGADTLNGGDGTDRVSYNGSNAGVTVNLTTGTVTGGHATGDVLTSIESIDGSNFNDTLRGGQGALGGSLFGFGGDDILTTGAAPSMLSGGDGNDRLTASGNGHTLVGGLGNDTYVVLSGTGVLLSEDLLNDVRSANSAIGGIDRVETWIDLNLSTGDATIENIVLFNNATIVTGNAGANTITGNTRDNRLFGWNGRDTIFGGIGDDTVDGDSGNDLVYGDAGDDTVYGDTGNDFLYGGDGNDLLFGGTGNDRLEGGAGDDFFSYEVGDTVVDLETTGVDFVWVQADFTLSGSSRLEILSVMSLQFQDWVAAYNAPDRITALVDLIAAHGIASATPDGDITGGFRDEVLIGYGAGTNTLAGLGGADTLIGDAGDTANYAASDEAVDINLFRGTQIGGHAEGDVIHGIQRVVGSAFDDIITTGGVPLVQSRETFYGGGGNDVLTGFGGSDKLYGGIGNDTLYGGDGNDTLSGESGRNLLYAGAGDDSLIAGDGNDILQGGAGADTMFGGRGNDVYHVDSAGDRVEEFGGTFLERDTLLTSVSYALAPLVSIEVMRTSDATATTTINLTGNTLNQTLIGNAGANRLAGGGGTDTMEGGLGNDVYITDGGDVVRELANAGFDRVESSASHTLTAFVEDLTLTGTAAADGTGNNGNNRITGNLGVNTLAGLRGADTLTGTNEDTVSYAASDAAVDINLSRATQTGGHAEGDVIVGIPRIIGSDFDDVITKGGAPMIASRETFYGGDGNDTLTGLGGNDRLYGDGDEDRLYGGDGDDTLYGGEARDSLYGGTGNDKLYGGLGAGVMVGGDGNDVLDGSTLADSLYGGDGNDTLTGNAGADLLDGGLGLDLMDGGSGNDTYIVRDTLNRVEEFTGAVGEVDTVRAAVSFTLQPLVHIEVLRTIDAAATTAINLTGNGLSQTITGNAGVNTLSDGGGSGADTLSGLGGNDTYFVRNAGTVIIEDAGNGTADGVFAGVSYALGAGVSIEAMSTTALAGTAAIDLTGNAFAQTITGNAGANRLDGNGGGDTLSGRGGADVFVFSAAPVLGTAVTVTDYAVADDRIELLASAFPGLATGDLAIEAFASNTLGAATSAEHRIIYETDTGALWFDRDGSGNLFARVKIADLTAGLAMDRNEFLIV